MNLVPLYEEAIQFNNFNGTVLAAGKVEVWYLGRTRKADIYADVAGETPLPNPLDLNDLGMQEVYVNPAFNYTLVVYDPYGSELFSVDKYLQGAGAHTTSNVVVQPSEHIGVSAWTVGEVQIYQPYLVGDVGKTYEGILPIVVNNDVNRISANHIPLGVQDPLYFVEDSETACIIGLSGGTVPEGTMNESAFGYQDGQITSYNGSAFSAGNSYEAGNYISIDNNTINVVNLPTSADVQTIVDVATSGLMPSGDYLTKESADTLYAPTGNYLTGLPDDLVYTADITGLATTAQLDEKLDKSESGNFYPMEGNPSGFLTAHQSLQGYATEQWVENKGYLTGVDIPESAVWNATTQTVSANSAQWAGGTANPQIPVTGINGIKISESGDKVVFEVSGDYYPGNNPSGFITGVDLSDYATTAQVAEKQDSLTFGYKDTAISSIDNSAIYDNSAHARITTLAGRISDLSSNKLDATAFSDVSGTFLTAHQDLSDYQTTAGMTAYANSAILGGTGLYGLTTAGWSIIDTGATYTSPSGTIRIAGDTLEGTTSAVVGDSITDVVDNGDVTQWMVLTALPNYPYGEYLLRRSDLEPDHEIFCVYGNWNYTYYEHPPVNETFSVPLVREGYPLTQIQSNGSLSAIKDNKQVVELALKSDLVNYQLTSDMTAYLTTADSANFLTAVPDTYLQNTDLTISDGKITEISGVPLSAGTELEFEYDAADNISAINNSAISTTPSQALYAQNPLYFSATGTSSYMGINSADLARILGVDETVLWSGARQTTGTIQLSESMWNYNTMDIYVCPDYNTYSTRMGYQITRLTVIPQIDNNEQLLCYAKSNRIASNTYLSELFYLKFNPDGSSVDFSPGIKWSNNTVTTGVTAFTGAVTKIVGIGRKQ